MKQRNRPGTDSLPLAKIISTAKHLSSKILSESMKGNTTTRLLAAILFALLIVVGSAKMTSSVDVAVLKNGVGVDDASVWVDGQYKGVTGMGGYLYIPDLSVGYHTVNARYEDNSGKYVGISGFEINSGFEILPGGATRVNLERPNDGMMRRLTAEDYPRRPCRLS